MSSSSDQKAVVGMLRQKFLDQPPETHTKHWDDLWQKETTPWDRNGPSIALKDTITQRQDFFGSPLKDDGSKQRKKALVPGCGRGYDVLLLASLGYDTYGLDASATAISAARKLQAEATANDSSSSSQYTPHDPTIGSGTSTFLAQDFFTNDFLPEIPGESHHFDLIFDYTFLCALPPSLRPAWAKRMSELLAPDGHLVCLEWPLGKAPQEGGPPHGLTAELYVQLFRNPGKEVQYDSEGKVSQEAGEEDVGGPGDGALVRISHVMPERTHEAGKGKDYVGIWKHV